MARIVLRAVQAVKSRRTTRPSHSENKALQSRNWKRSQLSRGEALPVRSRGKGSWLMAEDAPRRQPTLDEVTELAGVSRSVASRAINNAPHVSRAEREAVERAVRRLGYVPDPTARALAARPTGAAAPVVSGEDPSIFASPFFDQVIVGASAALEKSGLHLMLCLAASGRSRKRVGELLRSGPCPPSSRFCWTPAPEARSTPTPAWSPPAGAMPPFTGRRGRGPACLLPRAARSR